AGGDGPTQGRQEFGGRAAQVAVAVEARDGRFGEAREDRLEAPELGGGDSRLGGAHAHRGAHGTKGLDRAVPLAVRAGQWRDHEARVEAAAARAGPRAKVTTGRPLRLRGTKLASS